MMPIPNRFDELNQTLLSPVHELKLPKATIGQAGVYKSSHPVFQSDLEMSLSSVPACIRTSSPDTSLQSIRAVAPIAPSQASTSNNSSMKNRRQHDSFMLSGSVFLITANGKTLSLPIPSQDPSDPLNWTWKKRVVALLPVTIFSIICVVVTQGASLAYAGLRKEFPDQKIYYFTIETLLTGPTLSMGIGTFFWVPLTYAFGRRPPLILASVILFVMILGAAVATEYWVLLGCLCGIGFAEGFALSVGLLITIDLTFIHQRPHAIAMIWSIVGALGLFSLASIPYTADNGVKWRNMFYYWSIPAGIASVSAILLFPETYFERPAVAYDGLIIHQTASEKLTIYNDEGATANWAEYDNSLPKVPNRNWAQNLFDPACLRITKASWKKFFLCYAQIIFCFLNPLIFWVVIMTAINFAGMVFIGATYSPNLTAPPYKLSSQLLVLVNISSGVGALIAYPLGGYLLCFILKRLSKRNKGVREAEHYLIGYILPVLLGATSTTLYGLALERKWHFTVYYLAYGLSGFSFTAISITNTLWVTEAFPRWAAPALVVVGGGSYMISYSISFALMPWIMKQGYMLVGTELGAMQIFSGLVILPIVFWGKGLRQRIHGRWAENREGALRPR